MNNGHNSKNTMYSPTFERDNCGFGLIANMDDKTSSWIIDTSIEARCLMMVNQVMDADY